LTQMKLDTGKGKSKRSKVNGESLLPPIAGKHNMVKVCNQSRLYEFDAGVYYWHLMNKQMIEEVGEENLRVYAGLFCALSPNNAEKNNWKDVRYVYGQLSKGMELDVVNAPIHTYKHTLHKCVKIWKHRDNEASIWVILGGTKTQSMFLNIVDPYDEKTVTVDGHMVSCYQGKKLTMDNAGIDQHSYNVIGGVIKEIAREKGLIGNQVQAILWLTWRRLNRVAAHRDSDLSQMRMEF
jgi:hypothetical protein